jgi:hypothetical protein
MTSADTSGPFSKTTLWVVISVALMSLTVTVVLTVIGGDPTENNSAGTDGYSRSAIGHRGLISLLEKLDVPVVVSRNNSAPKAEHGVLVIAEPKLVDGDTDVRLDRLIEQSSSILVVLPKWYGYAKAGDPWIDDAEILPRADVDAVARAIGITGGANVERAFAASHWTAGDGFVAPVVEHAQTLPADVIDPEITDNTRVLLGHFDHDGKTIWVLTDPDVISNFGLRHPENAQLAIRVLDRLRHDGPVVFDETVHGHAQAPSLLRVLFQFPLVLATLQVLICAVLAVWAAMVRFGPRRAAPPPLAPGKDFLIANTAALLRYGGHHVDALHRYLAANIAAVRHALHAPANLGPRALTEWLERIRTMRGGTISLTDLEREAASPTPQRIVEIAGQIYRWRLEMMHGSRNRT